MRAKTFKVAPFPTTLKLKFTKEPPAEDAVGLTSLEGSVITIAICINDSSKVVPTIVHEAVHAMQFTQSYVEGAFDDETQAYLVEQIALWILAQWQKHK